jgi:aryl-phospho-beta-D-glucosidase BglC (GH1 family)
MTEKDVRVIAGWGMNAIRAGFWGVEDPEHPFHYDEEAFERVDRSLDWCEKYGIQCILCYWDNDTEWWGMAREPGKIWDDDHLQERFVGVWAAVAERYRERPTGLHFELMNEPRAVNHDDWNQLARKATKAIRETDERHTIIVESNRWGETQTFSHLRPTGDANTIYSFHFYEPLIFTNQSAPWMITFRQFYREAVPYPGTPPRLDEYIQRLPGFADEVTHSDLERSRGHWDKPRLEGLLKPALEFGKKHQVPLFCGEFGVNWRAPREDAHNWLRDVLSLFTEHEIGWTYWYYRDMDFGLFDSLRLDHTNPPEYLDRETLGLLTHHLGA